MSRHIELNPVYHLTIGAIGEPGKRTFYLQGSQGAQVVSVIIEKEQAAILANSFEALLSELSEKHPQETRESQEEPFWTDLRLRQPIEPLFRVGHMGLGYNEDSDQIVLVAYELVDEGDEPNVVSFWANRDQIRSLVRHVYEVVRAGRPICGNCGRPIDAEGHFCPNRNGHIH
jgi:uncharacterized repeat protein (TIGR03847 family)